MSLGPAALADRLEAAARALSRHDPKLAEACTEAADFFREEFDVAPCAPLDHEDTQAHEPVDSKVVKMPCRTR